jgi:hypothetical protein
MSDERAVTIRQTDGSIRIIGVVRGVTFTTEREEKKHMYRCGAPTLEIALASGSASWGIDKAACEGLSREGVIYFDVLTDKKRYSCKLNDFLHSEEAFSLHHKPHRAQLFLPLRSFIVETR